MQEGKFIEQAKTVLGHPVVAVYTTDDMIKQFVDLGFSKLRNKVLRKVTFALPIKDVQKINPQEVPLITDVVPYTNNADRQVVYVRDDFDLAIERAKEQLFEKQYKSIFDPKWEVHEYIAVFYKKSCKFALL